MGLSGLKKLHFICKSALEIRSVTIENEGYKKQAFAREKVRRLQEFLDKLHETDLRTKLLFESLDQKRRCARNAEICKHIVPHFTFFANEHGVRSIFDWASDKKVKINQPLVFVMARIRGLTDQHAFLLIERLNPNQMKEIVTYELCISNGDKKAAISCRYPDLSSDRLAGLLNCCDRGYQARCHAISQEQLCNLTRNLDNDVERGRDFKYHKNAYRDSNGERRTNCAVWLAEHLEKIGLPADLSWLNLPSDLVGHSYLRQWMGRR